MGNHRQYLRKPGAIEVTRAEKVWDIRKRCIKANDGVLWNNHGDILMRVISPGRAVPTKISLADVLLTWKWVCDKRVDKSEGDEDAAKVLNEITAQIEALWDGAAADLTTQSDKCIDLLADHLLVDIPRAKRTRT
jgi:hypothetical protein